MTVTAHPPLTLAPDLYRWSGQLAQLLARLRRAFADDFDQYLLYMVFVEAELARGLAAQKGVARPQPKGLNALSVAILTRLPRETVRRKLHALAQAGLLHLGPDGLHYLSGQHGVDAFIGHLRPLARQG